MMSTRFTQLVVLFFVANLISHEALANAKPFGLWLEELKQDAANAGVSTQTIDQAIAQIGDAPNEKVIALDRKQPEKTKTFEQYITNVVNDGRINRAISEYKKHQQVLERVGSQYGVQPEYIVALWAIESNFGERMGNFSIIRSLASLAYDGRRSDYFRGELIKAMKIIDDGHISADDMLGSWAGAMGMCQFMPSSFYAYAVDADGDGRKNIWGDTDDVFASVANYLSSVGWNDDYGWGTPVNGGSSADASKKLKLGFSEWQSRGVAAESAIMWNAPTMLISGNSNGRGPYFLTTTNYDNILKWNRSRYFAVAVGTLADAIAKGVK